MRFFEGVKKTSIFFLIEGNKPIFIFLYWLGNDEKYQINQNPAKIPEIGAFNPQNKKSMVFLL